MTEPLAAAGFDYAELRELADTPVLSLFRRVASCPRGLTETEAAERLHQFGENEPPREHDARMAARWRAALASPFVGLLAALGAVFVVLRDARGAVTVAVMITLAVALRVWQQTRSINAARALRDAVPVTVTVRRRAAADDPPRDREIPISDVVPGDVVVLRAGDVVPADMRIVSSSDLVVDQSVLTGEALPATKSAPRQNNPPPRREPAAVPDTASVCFSGTIVIAGFATGVVVATGARTYAGALAASAAALRPDSSFDRGVRAVSWTLVRFMLAMAPVVFVISGLVHGLWTQAAMLAVAVAVGLTPEMLPVIVTANLARGATRLAREKVIVSRLNAIQDLAAMDVLCVDKTGTLTEDRIVYAHSVDITGRLDDSAGEFAYTATYFQDTPYNQLDDAVTEMFAAGPTALLAEAAFTKVGEIPFDYDRRRATVVVSRQAGEHILICKGDPDQVLARCTWARLDDQVVELDELLRAEADDVLTGYRRQGMRVLAVAARPGPAGVEPYGPADEHDLILAGFLGFVDPVRESAAGAVATLAEHRCAVKILTGDARTVARHVAEFVGVPMQYAMVGEQLDRLHGRRLRAAVARCHVFAELTPEHKTRVVAALREDGRAVGFLGDGVNDVAALRLADAGIAADTATAAAKQAADLILADRDLTVIARGVVEGRRTLANTMKYIRITASSNFGNALSVLAAGAVLPFLPMLPIQLLVGNLLYDTAQLSLPWDRVDTDDLRVPRRWRSQGLVGFMLVFGALSSLFDAATFAALWWMFGGAGHPAVFQTGWFIEGLLTQLLIVLVLRTRAVPWRRPRPAAVVVAAALVGAGIGLALPVTPLAGALRMAPPPPLYAVWLVVVAACYATAAHLVKRRYLRRCHWL